MRMKRNILIFNETLLSMRTRLGTEEARATCGVSSL